MTVKSIDLLKIEGIEAIGKDHQALEVKNYL